MSWRRRQVKKRRPPRAGETALMKRDGALALIFVNTAVDGPLADYAGLVTWARDQGALSSAEAARLFGLAAEEPDGALTVFDAAEELHELLSGIFNALADGRSPRAEEIERLNEFLGGAVTPPQLCPGKDGQGWALGESREEDLERPLWAVVNSAADVLASMKVARCAREGCGRLFVRRNPGSPRKWCGEVCGRRIRRHHYYRNTEKPYRATVKRLVRQELEAERKARAGPE